MQNHELELALSNAQDAIALYNFSPSSYFTLSKAGEIIGLTLTGANLLGKERSDVSPVQSSFIRWHDPMVAIVQSVVGAVVVEMLCIASLQQPHPITVSPRPTNRPSIHV